jgi:endonuclease/exonuclease/phosphatase family metal-dependent hydrolase
MPPFAKPRPLRYDLGSEVAGLRHYRDHAEGRAIPAKRRGRLLIATWNIANLGVQSRTPSDYGLIAEIISWFDLVAVQETNDDLSGLRAVLEHLPDSYRAIFSGASGNNERMTFVYDSRKVSPLEKVGALNLPPSELPAIKVNGVRSTFAGFDRNPYMAAFKSGDFTFLLVNVHLYYGGAEMKAMGRRILETYAVARWADQRRTSPSAYTPNILALGDFNLPQAVKGDAIYDELTSRGLTLPQHSTSIGSSIVQDNHYDQIAFFPGDIAARFVKAGVFDFDGAVFRPLWNKPRDKDHKKFFAYVRYYMSDHRPLWAEFKS